MRILHPNKTDNPQAKEAFNLVESAYRNILDEQNRRIFQRVVSEAKGRVKYQQEVEKKTFNDIESQIDLECRKLILEIEEKKKHLF